MQSRGSNDNPQTRKAEVYFSTTSISNKPFVKFFILQEAYTLLSNYQYVLS